LGGEIGADIDGAVEDEGADPTGEEIGVDGSEP
jgi:hypothetical protein